MIKFAKATKKQSRARVALIGPAGSGKTYTSLAIASALGARVGVIDTERGSSSKYSKTERRDGFEFDVVELESFEPATYVEAIHAGEREGFDVIVIDSLSHAWMGKGGALEQVDMAAGKSKSGNSYTAWRSVTPMHNALVDAMLQCRAHLIVTMRTKTEYVLEEDDRGRKVPKKVGLAPVQREGLDYEFDVTGEINLNNDLVIDKTRCPELKGKMFHKAGADLAGILKDWLDDGAAGGPSVFDEILSAFEVAPDVAALASLKERTNAAFKSGALRRDQVDRIVTVSRETEQRLKEAS